jgi:hypothetical protein
METSLRYGTSEKHLLLHAKENFLLDNSFYLQNFFISKFGYMWVCFGAILTSSDVNAGGKGQGACAMVHGKLNTHTGKAHGVAQLKRKFYPELLTSLDVGAKFDSQFRELTYDIQGKKTLPVTDNGLLSVDLKGGYNFNPGSKQGKPRGVVELSYKVFNFTEDQDLKLKLGYNVVKQKPYFQIRENNWTLNGEVNGGWSIIYDL